jgi:regulator of PEP synthase PpsR (kinase-PPPase family)
VKTIAADHTAMVEAISDRDAEAAERTAHAHAAQFRGHFMKFLESSIASYMSVETPELRHASAECSSSECSLAPLP